MRRWLGGGDGGDGGGRTILISYILQLPINRPMATLLVVVVVVVVVLVLVVVPLKQQ